ncbi:LexA family transcriptional regulator [Desulfolutivibrio sulfoxidireducens]|uniref:LexA family transcriptional regulator n=1 Tax=Desulfolutivibrio sulfoxidireducens TaxID=2773299 RepID=UPI00159CF4CD|nr:S24 family peptidase [Desulfolutivibrio sulfoxidireducens]QLA16622.1 phage repressor protein [Desulfolutivibrio sulfoxidireducens]QLA21598.1 phage repressor protein [Desulfolutivibrio sulfoxidireducens]
MVYQESESGYNTFEDAFERIKKSTGLRTQVEVAKLLDIRQSSISDAKRRKSIPDGWLIKLYQLYGLNPNWVLDGEQPQFLGERKGGGLTVMESSEGYGARKPKHHTVPVCAMTLPEGAEGGWVETPVESITIADRFHRPSLLVVRMDEEHMEPLIRRGAFVGIDKDRKTIRSGGIYALDLPVEGLVIKRLSYDAENAKILLRSENTGFEDQQISAEEGASRVVGRVVWVLQEL